MTENTASATGIVYLYRALWRFCAGVRGTLLAALTLLLFAQLVLLGVPYATGRAINTLQVQGLDGATTAALWLGATMALSLLSWAMHGPGRFLERNVSLHLRQQISSQLIERLVQLPLAWHESQHSGATAHRVQQSVNSMAGFAENQFVYLSSAVRLFGPIVALWWLEPWVGVCAVLGFVIITQSMTRFDRRMIKLAHQENDAERRYSATIIDALSNITTLFALRQARAVVALMQQRLQDVFAPVKRSIVINEFKWFTVDVSSRLLSCLLVVQFTWLASRHASAANGMTQALLIGNLYMVWEYAQQAGGVVTAIAAHFQAFARLQADYASADIIRDTPAAAHLVGEPIVVNQHWQTLNIEHLQFRHPASRSASDNLKQLNLTFQRGKRYALIGGSGSGKSTLLRILSGLYVADQVHCRIDAQSFKSTEQTARALRSMATLVPQDAEVFEGSLAENLALCESLSGQPKHSDFAPALKSAQADEFVDTSPSGLNARIAERGANWSGGQRSRIALARGILAATGSSLVLLDEPTASLDARTEARVYSELFRCFPEACIISSVHRINVLSRFDEIILLQEGTLIAQGTPEWMQAHCAEFQQLLAAYAQTHGNDEPK